MPIAWLPTVYASRWLILNMAWAGGSGVPGVLSLKMIRALYIGERGEVNGSVYCKAQCCCIASENLEWPSQVIDLLIQPREILTYWQFNTSKSLSHVFSSLFRWLYKYLCKPSNIQEAWHIWYQLINMHETLSHQYWRSRSDTVVSLDQSVGRLWS